MYLYFFLKKSTVNYIPCSGDFGFLFGYKYWNQIVTVPIVNTVLLFLFIYFLERGSLHSPGYPRSYYVD